MNIKLSSNLRQIFFYIRQIQEIIFLCILQFYPVFSELKITAYLCIMFLDNRHVCSLLFAITGAVCLPVLQSAWICHAYLSEHRQIMSDSVKGVGYKLINNR